MRLHPHAMAIINDLFDEELDPELFAEPARAAEPAPAHPVEPAAETDAPERRPQ